MTPRTSIRSRTAAQVALALGMVAWLAVTAFPASAVSWLTCTYDPGAKSVVIVVSGDPISGWSAYLRVGPGGVILVTDEGCGGATVTNTDSIHISDTATNSTNAMIDLRGGAFEPGATPEPSGLSEIEFTLDLGPGKADKDGLLIQLSDTGSQPVTIGNGGVSLEAQIDMNGDGDADVSTTGLTSWSGAPNYSVQGGAGDDTVNANGSGGTGGPFDRPLALGGGGGDDHLTGFNSPATPNAYVLLVGGSGDDELIGSTGPDTITDSGITTDMNGNGIVDPEDEAARDHLVGGGGNDLLEAGPGDDSLDGGAGNDDERGGLGNDTFDQGTAPNGADHLAGQAGIDRVSYAGRTVAVSVSTNTYPAANDGQGTEGDDADVENVTGGSGADIITGDAIANAIQGGPGNDLLHGEAGNDSLDGGPGDDRIIDMDNPWAPASGNDLLIGGDGKDLMHGSMGNDRLFGDAGEDDMYGDSGNDEMHGGAGFDLMSGVFGDDLMFGEDGPDGMNGGVGRDTMDGGAGVDYVGGDSDNDVLFGSDDDDTLAGGMGADIGDGGNGTDHCGNEIETKVNCELI